MMYDRTIETILKITEEEPEVKNRRKKDKKEDKKINFVCNWCGKTILQEYKTGPIICEHCNGLAGFIGEDK